VFYFPLHFP
jgi:hypothetical protein